MTTCSTTTVPPQGSELSSWKTGHYTEDGYDIFENFPDLNSALWDAQDKGMVPKLTPNHHVATPENMAANTSVTDGLSRSIGSKMISLSVIDMCPRALLHQMAAETRAIISWMESHAFVLGANFQGGERVVAYPFDGFRLNKAPESQRPHSRKKRQ